MPCSAVQRSAVQECHAVKRSAVQECRAVCAYILAQVCMHKCTDVEQLCMYPCASASEHASLRMTSCLRGCKDKAGKGKIAEAGKLPISLDMIFPGLQITLLASDHTKQLHPGTIFHSLDL
eukprot:1158219-Pelagomonas_calceolata.AAC.4